MMFTVKCIDFFHVLSIYSKGSVNVRLPTGITDNVILKVPLPLDNDRKQIDLIRGALLFDDGKVRHTLCGTRFFLIRK